MTCDCDNGKIWNNADPTSGQWVPCDCVATATKGPWFVKEAPVLSVVCQEDWPVICEITSLGDRPGYDGDELANARLIAAAPDLLQSAVLLESLCTWLLHAFGPASPAGKEAAFRATQARAAITKATPEGRS